MTTQGMTSGSEGLVEAHGFRQGIAEWARGYSMRYRHVAGPKPTMVQAVEDLRRWSTQYWAVCQPVRELVPPVTDNRGLHGSVP
jgi:hypothetical protein